MAFVFALALLLDSACAAACIPAELQTPPRHCSAGDRDHQRGCDLHAHLKPAVKNGSAVAPTPADDAPAHLGDDAIAFALESFGPTIVRDSILHIPPLFERSSVLRI